MLLCKKKTVIFSQSSQGNTSIREDSTNKCISCRKNNTKTNIYKNTVLSKKMSITKSSSLTVMDLSPLGKISSRPPQRLTFTSQLLHWVILGDFCRYSFMTSGNLNILYYLVFNISSFIDFALITLFLKICIVFSVF